MLDALERRRVRHWLAGGWGVDVRYRDNEFVQKIARPDVGKQFAFVFGGEVVSAPTVPAGITTNDVRISGALTQAQARTLAAVLASGALRNRYEAQ